MIRWNPKTGQWSDEMPSRLQSWVNTNNMPGAKYYRPQVVLLGQNQSDVAALTHTITLTQDVPLGWGVWVCLAYKTDKFLATGAWSDSRGNTYQDRGWSQLTGSPTTDLPVEVSDLTTALRNGDVITATFNTPGSTGKSMIAFAVSRCGFTSDAGLQPAGTSNAPSQAFGSGGAAGYNFHIAQSVYQSGTVVHTPGAGWTRIGSPGVFWTSSRTHVVEYKITDDQSVVTWNPTLSASVTYCCNLNRHHTDD